MRRWSGEAASARRVGTADRKRAHNTLFEPVVERFLGTPDLTASWLGMAEACFDIPLQRWT